MGLFAALLSTIFVTAKDTVSKKLASEVSGSVSAFASFLFALPFYVIVLGILTLVGQENFQVKGSFWLYITLRALSDTGAEFMKMHALTTGELSLVTSILSLYPIILLFISPLITGDVLSSDTWYATILTVVGTLILVFRPRNSSEPLPIKAILFASGAAVFFSINTSLDRMAAQTGSPTLSGFFMTAISGLCLFPLALKVPGWKTQLNASKNGFSLRGFFELAFMVSKLYALSVLSAPFVVAIQRIQLLFSVVSGKVVFKEQHFIRKFLASSLIVAGAIWMILRG